MNQLERKAGILSRWVSERTHEASGKPLDPLEEWAYVFLSEIAADIGLDAVSGPQISRECLVTLERALRELELPAQLARDHAFSTALKTIRLSLAEEETGQFLPISERELETLSVSPGSEIVLFFPEPDSEEATQPYTPDNKLSS